MSTFVEQHGRPQKISSVGEQLHLCIFNIYLFKIRIINITPNVYDRCNLIK